MPEYIAVASAGVPRFGAGPLSGRPAAGNPGHLYLVVEEADIYLSRDTGAAWRDIRSGETPAQILAKLVTVDGTGSGLDADTLDGVDSTGFALTSDARFHTRNHNLFASDHPDVLASDAPVTGDVLSFLDGIWTAAPPGALTVPNADETTRGVVEEATTAEVQSGAAGVLYVPAAKLSAELNRRENRVEMVRLFDDFIAGSAVSGDIGELGWLVTAAGALQQPSEANAPGILRRNTNATASQVISTQLNSANPILPATFFDMEFRFRLPTFVAGIGIRFGLLDTTTTVPANGLFIEHVADSGTLVGTARAAGAQGSTASLHTIVSDTWIKARLRRVDASTIAFSVNGGTEATLTANIPTVALSPVFQFTNGTAVVRFYDLDYFKMNITGITR